MAVETTLVPEVVPRPPVKHFKFLPTLCALVLSSLMLAVRGGAADFDPTHPLLEAVLKRHVKSARVDYAGLKAHPEDLKRYLAAVAGVGKAEFKRWNEAEQIAFLSNAYNAWTLQLVVDHYPVKSIKDIGSLLTGPWDQPVVRLFGETITLSQLEHGILRSDYTEPRIHFILVCASKGCPPLRNEAYTGTRLEEQLVDQARLFLADTTKNRVTIGDRTVHLSPIFKWYGADFEKKHGSVLAALKPYWPEQTGTAVQSDFKIRYGDYDWSLNGQEK